MIIVAIALIIHDSESVMNIYENSWTFIRKITRLERQIIKHFQRQFIIPPFADFGGVQLSEIGSMWKIYFWVTLAIPGHLWVILWSIYIVGHFGSIKHDRIWNTPFIVMKKTFPTKSSLYPVFRYTRVLTPHTMPLKILKILSKYTSFKLSIHPPPLNINELQL